MFPHIKEFEKTVLDVFDPKPGEHVGIVYDTPWKQCSDSSVWKDRRKLAEEWTVFFQRLGSHIGFDVTLYSLKATGAHNRMVSSEVFDSLKRFNVIIALTEFSITSSLVQLVRRFPDRIRCASMPGAQRRMHSSVYISDYSMVNVFAHSLESLIDKARSARILFSTSDEVVIDLRNRKAGADDGDCTKPGSVINFPSGEGFSAPYEGVGIEKDQFGESKTVGVIPFVDQGDLVFGSVKHNRFVSFDGSAEAVSRVESYFNKTSSRRNIAEFGIGCNPNAMVTGNRFEDEKAGVHIAYGMSSHLGGKVSSDVHVDLVFAKNCPVEATMVTLLFPDDSSVDIVTDSRLQYEVLKNYSSSN